MTKSPVIIMESDTLSKAFEILKESSFSHLPVLDQKNIVSGILSNRDIQNFNKLFDQLDISKKSILDNLAIKDVMTTHVKTIDKNQSVEDANDIILSLGVHALPVVENGHIIGIITETDILRYYNKKYST